MRKKKPLNNDKSQTVWQYVYSDEYNRINTSTSKFTTTKDAGDYFKQLKKEGSLKDCKLVGYSPVFQYIYS